MKNLILSLRHALCIALFSALFSQLYSQGNLQFNQVISFGGVLNAGSISGTNIGSPLYGSLTYTVPSGKVWKIESAMSNNGGTTLLFVNNLLAGTVGSGLSAMSPLWLKAGDIVRMGNSSNPLNTYFLSGIEFNIIP